MAAALIGDWRAVDEAGTKMTKLVMAAPSRDDGFSGRISMDVAFNLALAGYSEPVVFANLCDRGEIEVKRQGKTRRKSSGLSIAHMAERAAAAGCMHSGLFDASLRRMLELGWSTDAGSTASTLASGDLQLCHPRAARWLHLRHHHHSLTAEQRRVGQSSRPCAADDTSLGRLFDEPSRDLSVDLGCGFGVGALGLASADSEAAYNTLACDLNHAAVGFARGIASRWRIAHRCSFVVSDASALLQRLRNGEYDGRVARVVLSCPTPFAASTTRASAATLDFFAEPRLFDEIASTLCTGGHLHVASNVEDVAVRLFASALATGRFEAVTDTAAGAGAAAFSAIPPTPPTALLSEAPIPRRQALWREAGGERAEGAAWEYGAATLLEARSETELAYALESRPTYRFVVRSVA